MPKYAEVIYNGLWFSSERVALQNLIDITQSNVSGDVRLKLVVKGNVIVTGRNLQIVDMTYQWCLLMKKVIMIKEMRKAL